MEEIVGRERLECIERIVTDVECGELDEMKSSAQNMTAWKVY